MRTRFMLPALFVITLFTACDRQPYVESKVSVEKMDAGCDQVPATFKMVSNFGGERYVFSKCLGQDFTKDQMTVERSGDTVSVRFAAPAPAAEKNAYTVTLDIDSYPRYNYLSLDGEVFTIVYSGN